MKIYSLNFTHFNRIGLNLFMLMIIAVIPSMFTFSNGRFTNNRIKLSNVMLKKRTKYVFVNKHQMRDLKE